MSSFPTPLALPQDLDNFVPLQWWGSLDIGSCHRTVLIKLQISHDFDTE